MMGRVSFDEIRSTARGRWLEIIGEIVGKDYTTGKNTPCPGCGGSDRYQFNRRSDAGAFSCRGHDAGGGDGFALLMHVFSCDFQRAARMVGECLGMASTVNAENRPKLPPPTASAALPAIDWLRAKAKAAKIWTDAKPIATVDAAGLYLARRGIRIPKDAAALRFHPALDYWTQDEKGEPEFVGRPPALLAKITRPDGRGVGLHRIYLEADGRKFDYKGLPAKKILKAGDLQGAAVHVSSIADERLGIAEGVETAGAFARLTGVSCWSVLSASLMPSVEIPKRIRKVYIAADNDPAGLNAADKLANRLLSAGLQVWICKPAHGKDWNDDLLHRIQAGEVQP